MAARFWVGGTGTWDASDTTHWAATTGGAGGQTVPTSADSVTFDGSSGAGTVTVNTTVAIISLTCGAHTGTLDFSANNNSVTLTGNFSGTGSATRTLNLGNGTWTLTSTGTLWNFATVTGLTFNANSSSLVFTATSSTNRTFSGGGLSYSSITVSANSSGGGFTFSGANTVATLAVTAPNAITFPNGVTTAVTNAFTWTGSSSNQIAVNSDSLSTQATVSVASGSPTMSWAGVRRLVFSGGATFTATSSFDLGNNSGITITAPSAGGGGGISRARAASGF